MNGRAAAFIDRLAGKNVPPAAADACPPELADDDPGVLGVHPVIVRLADVQPESVSWIWPGRLAQGKLTLLVGNAGLGKSWLTLDVAARVSTGRPWPDGSPASAIANVLMLSAEDGLADTVRPRLDALGADVTRVHHLAVLRAGEKERAVQLRDTDAIGEAIAQTRARVLTIDPVSAYLGSTDSHRDAEVRGLLAPLALLAERTGTAILGVMHLAKGGQRPAIHRAVGSIAFAAAARIVLAVAADHERAERVLVVPVKTNLSARPAALAFTLREGRLVWEANPVDNVDVESLLETPITSREQREEQTDAEQVIAGLLEDFECWPLEAKTALAAGASHGVHERTLQRTARRLGIRIARVGFGRGGRWLWYRPPIDDTIGDTPLKTENVSPMSSMQNPSAIGNNNNIDDTGFCTTRAREAGAEDDDGSTVY